MNTESLNLLVQSFIFIIMLVSFIYSMKSLKNDNKKNTQSIIEKHIETQLAINNRFNKAENRINLVELQIKTTDEKIDKLHDIVHEHIADR